MSQGSRSRPIGASRPRLRCLGSAFILAILAASSGKLPAAGFRFVLPTVNARPGEALRYTIQGDIDRPVQGFSLALRASILQALKGGEHLLT